MRGIVFILQVRFTEATCYAWDYPASKWWRWSLTLKVVYFPLLFYAVLSFNKYLLSSYYVAGVVLYTLDAQQLENR